MKNTKYFIGLNVHKEHNANVIRNKSGNILIKGETATLYKELYPTNQKIPNQSNYRNRSLYQLLHPIQNFLKQGYNIKVVNTLQLRQLIKKTTN